MRYLLGFKTRCERILWLLIFITPFQAHAARAINDWTYHRENDRLTNLTYSFARSPMPRIDLYDNLRLEIACKENKLQVSVETENLITSHGSAFEFEYQIDKQLPVKIQMHAFSDSKRKGYTEDAAKQFADAMLTGQSVFIRVTTMIRRVLSGEMPLDNAATPIKQVYADCGLVANNTDTQVYSLATFNDAFAKLAVEQQRTVLTKLRAIMTELVAP